MLPSRFTFSFLCCANCFYVYVFYVYFMFLFFCGSVCGVARKIGAGPGRRVDMGLPLRGLWPPTRGGSGPPTSTSVPNSWLRLRQGRSQDSPKEGARRDHVLAFFRQFQGFLAFVEKGSFFDQNLGKKPKIYQNGGF